MLRAACVLAVVLVAIFVLLGACGGTTFVAGSTSGDAAACVPKLCPDLHVACGMADDGCGHTLNCGSCAAPYVCTADTKTCVCASRSCATLGAGCGTIDDGCGNMLACGACDAGVCGGGGDHQCGPGTCVPKTCAMLSGQCGTLSDGCGNTIDCTCASGTTCGGGGKANECGCTAKTCAGLGWTCGTGSNGCGGTLNCGMCAGGACVNNACNCTAQKTCANQHWTCGSFDDTCGATETCGPAPARLTQFDALCVTKHGAAQGSAYGCVACDAGASNCMSQASGDTPPEPGWDCVQESFSGGSDGWCCNPNVIAMPE